MSRIKLITAVVIVLTLCAFAAMAEVAFPRVLASWHTGALVDLPGTLTDVIASKDSYVDAVLFANDDATAVATIRMVDKSTNCGGAGCPLWPDVTLAAKAFYVANMHGVFAAGGIQWKATGSAKVSGWMKGRY